MTRVIASLDGTPVTDSITDHAVWAAQRMEAPLRLLHILDRAKYPTTADFSGHLGLDNREQLLSELAALDEQRGRLAREQGRRLLEAQQQRAAAAGLEGAEVLQRHGDVLETLVEMEEDTRLLVMGKHDENIGEHIGGRLETVVRTLRRPILVCTPTFQPPRSLMIAFDGSATTHKGVDRVAGSPLFRALPCHVVMIGSDSKKNQGQLQWARDTLEASDFVVTTQLLSGEVEQALCDYRKAHEIDLIVMGAYGHSAIRRFLVGSTTTCVMRNAKVPVLLLR